MERLTGYLSGSKYAMILTNTELSSLGYRPLRQETGDAIDRLAAYEDTDFPPDEVAALKSERDQLQCKVLAVSNQIVALGASHNVAVRALKMACQSEDDPMGFMDEDKISHFIQQAKEAMEK
jgi:hypothetical protein